MDNRLQDFFDAAFLNLDRPAAISRTIPKTKIILTENLAGHTILKQ
jgi:hypothetical protein